MSKIFDGLQKTEGAIAKLTIDVIGDASSGPAPAGKDAATDANGGKQQAFHRSTGVVDLPANAGFPFEAAAEGFRTLSDTSAREFSQPPAAPDQKALGSKATQAHDTLSQEPGQSGLAPAAQVRSADAALEPFPSSWLKSAPHDSGPRSVVIRLRAGSPLLPFNTGEADAAAEEYRRVRTKILQHRLQPSLMLVSSPAPGDGKSITALNIGGALALNRDARVLLVDMDLRRPTIAGLLGLPEQAGVADILAGSCGFEDAVVRLEPFPNLFLLPAGRDRRNPAELLSSPRWKALCDEFRSRMTYTVFDGPPVDAVAEYSLLEKLSDGLILVVRTDHTVRSLLYGALESVPKEKLLGTIVNSYRESFFWKQRGDYYY